MADCGTGLFECRAAGRFEGLTRIIVQSAMVGAAIGLVIAATASLLGNPLDMMVVGVAAGVGAGIFAAYRTHRQESE